jgi:flagellar L-ring protein precursor FlgH
VPRWTRLPVVQRPPGVVGRAGQQRIDLPGRPVYRPLFEDHRARLVGDTLTVQIVEKRQRRQQTAPAGSTAAAFQGVGQP